MMRHAVAGFDHRPGAHCASTAMRDVLEWKGVPLSEPMVLGLGAGPWFVLFEGEGLSPGRFFHGRSVAFEHDLCEALGIRFDETSEPFEVAFDRMRALLDANEPVLLTTDVRWLPHFATHSHFNGHRVVLVGLADDGRAWLTDSHFEGVLEVPAEEFRRSVTSGVAPLVKTEVMFGPLVVDVVSPVAPLVRPALRRCAHANLDASEFTGIGGVERLAETLPEWAGLTDATWAARFAYQVIEKRGNGGGLFRRLYAKFLDEAATVTGDVVARSLVAPCVEAADRWTALALELRAVSESASPDFRNAAKLAARVAVAERTLWEAAAERLG